MDEPAHLVERLRRIHDSTAPARRPADPPKPKARPPEGWKAAGRLLWVRHTELANPLSADRPLRLLGPERISDDRLLFLDTETTGLSGGAGTIAFLVGIGRPAGRRLRITQFFAADYPGEVELIDALGGELNESDVVVSYNGKSFDIPILRGRFAFAGKPLAIGTQIDLLHTARRLWRNSIGSCSLHAVEERVLGVERSEDVPGFLVPELYFEYLATGDSSVLSSVFVHHLYDVVSLASLLEYIETIPNRPLDRGGVNPVELGRIMLDLGLPAGVDVLTECALGGSFLAAQSVSRYLKRAGRWSEAAELWSSLWERSSSYFAGIELAKYYEHRSRDHRKALELVERIAALPLFGRPSLALAREEVIKRRERLMRKISRRGGVE